MRIIYSNRPTRGSALVWVLILGTILMTTVISSYSLTTHNLRMQHRGENFAASLHAAEAGIEYAIHALNTDDWTNWQSSGNSRTCEVTFNNHDDDPAGEFFVTIDDITSEDPLIVSTGNKVQFSNVKRSVRVKVHQETVASFFDWGIYAYNWLSFGSDFRMDSYNSNSGVYPGWYAGSQGNIGGYNVSDTKFGSNGTVYGSLQVNGPVNNSGTTITGTTIKNSAGTPPPPFPDSDLAAAKSSNLNASIKFYKTGTTQNASNPWKNTAKTKADIGSDVDIVMAPGEYYFEELFIGSKVKLIVSPAGPVNIWMNTSSSGNTVLKVGSDFRFNQNTKIPANLNFKIKAGKVEFASTGIFYGTLFAPNSEVLFQSTNQIYGAVVAKRFEIQSNNYFHYDESLRSPAGGAGVLVTYWSEGVPEDNS